MWRVNNELLKTREEEEIKCEDKICIKTKENASVSYQNFDLKTMFFLNGHNGPIYFFKF